MTKHTNSGAVSRAIRVARFTTIGFASLLAASSGAVPVITLEPQDASVQYGQQATLSVQATGSALLYQWYRGTQGDTSVPVAGKTNATLVTDAALNEATYWVKVSDTQGSAQSRTTRVAPSEHTVIYFTDFESFPVGAGNLAGRDGWSTNVPPCSGILATNAGLTGKSAYLGASGTTAGTIQHDFRFRPLNGANKVIYSFDLKLVDSTGPKRDAFYFHFYNDLHEAPAKLDFDNAYMDSPTVWTYNGASWTGQGFFLRDHFYHVWIEMDYGSNQWRMELNGQTVFSNLTFNTVWTSFDSSYLSIDLIRGGTNPGDNFLVLDNFGVAVEGVWGPVLSKPNPLAAGIVTMNLLAAHGQQIVVQTSTNLLNWEPLTTFSFAGTTNNVFDNNATGVRRFYRAVVVP